jgi:ABC-type multidrug transport system fused ATPase/permease subunit
VSKHRRKKGKLGLLQDLTADSKAPMLAIIGVLALLSTASSLAVPWAVGKIIANLSDGGMNRWTWLLVAMGIGSAAAGAVGTFLLSRLGQQMVCSLRIRTMRHVLGMRMSEIREEGGGGLVSRITDDIARLKRLIDVGPVQLPMAGLTVVGTLVIMGVVDWVLLLVTVGAFLVAAALIVLVVKALRRNYMAVQEGMGLLAQRFHAAVDAVKVIKAYRAEEQIVAGLADEARSLARREIAASKVEALMTPSINLGQQIALVAVIAVGGARLLEGQLSLADFVSFLMYLLQLTGPVMMASSGVTAVKMGLVSHERFTELFAKEQESSKGWAAVEEQPAGVPAVRFEQVDFSYGSQPVLRKADFHVPAKGLTALVGLSGSGKTTSLELIERFAQVDAGQVSVFGIDVDRWELSRLRAHMAYLDQASTLVQDTVRANLTLGGSVHALSDRELMQALEQVGLADVVRGTPEGLDTVLAGSTDLSGGQRQRLGIARAMLTEAPLILLDEPSSSLDSLNEQKLRGLVDKLAQDRAVLVVAHRISTIQHADHVIVFEGGEVVGQGSHRALLRECPQYAQLVRGQALIGEAVAA